MGLTDGALVGRVVGLKVLDVGLSVGNSDGISVGNSDGINNGMSVGIADGKNEGINVGQTLGLTVGNVEGELLGSRVDLGHELLHVGLYWKLLRKILT